MTVMIQKVGNGAPAPGELKRGELGLDLNSSVIYSSSNGSDIVVMGISEVKWEEITGVPDFILNIDPNVPGYIDITELEGRVTINEGAIQYNLAAITENSNAIADNASDIKDLQATVDGDPEDPADDGLAGQVQANTNDIESLQVTVDGDPDNPDDDGLVGQVQVNVTEIANLWAALGDAVTGLVLGGKYDATNNVALDVTPEGSAAGLADNQALPITNETKGIYVIVTVGGELEGTQTAQPAAGDHRADGQQAYPGDWLLSDGQHGWILMDFHTDATEWGTIGGTITNQSDLMSEFGKYILKTDTIDAGTYTAARK